MGQLGASHLNDGDKSGIPALCSASEADCFSASPCYPAPFVPCASREAELNAASAKFMSVYMVASHSSVLLA